MLWAGFLAPILFVALVGMVARPGRLGGLAANLEVLGHFLLPARPFTITNFFLDAPFAPTFNIWAVGACFSLAVYALTQGGGDLAVRRHFVASAIWCGLYTPLMLSLDYFPDRYKAHVLVPLAINEEVHRKPRCCSFRFLVRPKRLNGRRSVGRPVFVRRPDSVSHELQCSENVGLA